MAVLGASSDWYLEVALQKIQLGENTGCTNPGCQIRDVRHRIVVWLCDKVEASVISAWSPGAILLRCHVER